MGPSEIVEKNVDKRDSADKKTALPMEGLFSAAV